MPFCKRPCTLLLNNDTVVHDRASSETLAAYEELTALYHAEKQVERLYDGTWRGYTCPPFAECENMGKPAMDKTK